MKGTRRGKLVTVYVEAPDYQGAVRAATYAPHMLVVREGGLVTNPAADRAAAIRAYEGMTR